jgi:hypothetical protein
MQPAERMAGTPREVPLISPQAIDWERALLRSASGGYALIYEVIPGVVAKVGFVEPEEASLQGKLAQRGWPLPVIGYAQATDLPPAITQAVCSEHGLRELPQDMIACSCGRPLSVLLMPEADPDVWAHFDAPTVARFIEQVSSYCFEEPGERRNAEERNVAVYRGRLVALDCGDPDAPCW